MKKLIIAFLLIGIAGTASAQSEKYMAAMKKNMALIDSASTPEMNLQVAQSFKRIAEAEKNQWHPYYYAALTTVISAFTEKDKLKVDGIADMATELIDKAMALSPDNSEIYIIKSMIASARMMVDPQSRWAMYGQESTENLQKAKQLDPANPRALYLEGQAKLYTPESFGGGKQAAKPYFEKAIELYE